MSTGPGTAESPDGMFNWISSQDLAALVETIVDPVYSLDADWRIRYLNPRAAALMDEPRASLIGRSVWEVSPELVGTLFFEEAHRVMKTQQAAQVDFRLPAYDVWVSASLYPDTTGGLVVYVRSIERRKKVEKLNTILLELVGALSSALTMEDVASIILDTGLSVVDGHIGWISRLSTDRLALQLVAVRNLSDEAIQRYALLPLHLASPVTDCFQSGEAVWFSSLAELEASYPSIGQGIRTEYDAYSVACLPVRVSGYSTGVLVLSLPEDRAFDPDDQAFLMRLADAGAQAMERAAIYEAESNARRAAERAMRLQLEFISMLSHDIRGPLTSIQGFTSTLLAPDLTWDAESEHQFLEIISQETERLTELIKQLLDFSSFESGRFPINPVPSPIEAVIEPIQPVVLRVQGTHPLEIDVQQNLPSVLCDSPRLVQVLQNLIGNAAKFSPPGTPIRVAVYREAGFVRFDVCDSGPGIPADQRLVVFRPFHRVKSEVVQKTEGMGLGLAIARHIVQAHGGHIWVDPRRNPGTTISFTVPVASPPPDHPTSHLPVR